MYMASIFICFFCSGINTHSGAILPPTLIKLMLTMKNDIEYAINRISALGMISEEEAIARRKSLAFIQEKMDKTVSSELERFLNHKFDSRSGRELSRGDFVFHHNEYKVDYLFDGENVFSVDLRPEDGQWACTVSRYYQGERS